ncbi:hypothetical protein [Nonomuraea angiospora]|uniref:hypothetical protein n=1 Tax=Nonomuraea angiospora TaxID=46172 RepID=UPI0029BBF2B6|nr:hypothetical protein [Nonomuraea angiospora]MDX3107626.1 hypothetical protein [Nonomuraea angiospora]
MLDEEQHIQFRARNRVSERDTIASAAGMGTVTTLRRQLHRTIGVPPDTYRRMFRHEAAVFGG